MNRPPAHACPPVTRSSIASRSVCACRVARRCAAIHRLLQRA
ncbi:hypothetical protein ANK1_3938 [plant metagenome]|uniref:Uncharacterized protein n=1 Tax=plant metagenome TaxID=1297885 RepID=A0A484SCB4_9ZZZZ